MPVAAKISSKRLGVRARAGCCIVTKAAPGESPGEARMSAATKTSSRRLGVPGRAGSTPWSAAAPKEGPGKAGITVAFMS